MATVPGWGRETLPFHEGELAVQERIGVKDRIQGLGQRSIRLFMPDQHREFYEMLPYIVVGSVDCEGWPWISLVTGKPGFIQSPDDRTLLMNGTVLPDDPLHQSLRPGAALGLIGLQLSTRRRNRVNMTVDQVDENGVKLSVDVSFGNCPQYIQTREFAFTREAGVIPEDLVTECFERLNEEATAMIRGADTLFVASAVKGDNHGELEGVDASHRGGKPGFVKVDGNTLTVPDYAGNNFYNTLGNFHLNPKAGITFVDFETGDLLMLTGTVEILWDDDPEVTTFKGAERAWRFTLDHGQLVRKALPFRWAFGDYSPNALMTGDWEDAAAKLAAEAKRREWRPYRVTKVEDESSVIRSFYLEAADGDGLLTYEAGQYLTLRVKPEGHDKAVIRTYTLSSAPEDSLYRISIKREVDGLVSDHLHETLKVGDILEARAPKGDFTIDAAESRPAVLLAGGVGITPIVSMTRHLFFEGARTRSLRPLTIFQATQTTDQRAFLSTFQELVEASEGRFRYFSIVEKAAEGEAAGKDFNGVGRINAEMLRQTLPLDDYDFCLCGPAPFMQGVYDILRELGVRDGRIFAEAFGPASLKRQCDEAGVPAFSPQEGAQEAMVTFSKSLFDQGWTAEEGTLLEFAENHGVMPEFGCRAGTCGSCAVKVKKGKVAYLSEPIGAHAEDEALICCAVPAKGTDELELGL